MSEAWQHRSVSLHDLASYYSSKDDCVNNYTIIYEVSVLEGESDLLYGVTCIHPGKVGEEYYMTKGHRHLDKTLGEVYLGQKGTGILRLWHEDGSQVDQRVFPGSIHLIQGAYGHRLINNGDEDLVVSAVWSKYAGYDYFLEVKE